MHRLRPVHHRPPPFARRRLPPQLGWRRQAVQPVHRRRDDRHPMTDPRNEARSNSPTGDHELLAAAHHRYWLGLKDRSRGSAVQDLPLHRRPRAPRIAETRIGMRRSGSSEGSEREQRTRQSRAILRYGFPTPHPTQDCPDPKRARARHLSGVDTAQRCRARDPGSVLPRHCHRRERRTRTPRASWHQTSGCRDQCTVRLIDVVRESASPDQCRTSRASTYRSNSSRFDDQSTSLPSLMGFYPPGGNLSGCSTARVMDMRGAHLSVR